MSTTFENLMWGHQTHFRVEQERVAESIFQFLDERLVPEIFLVGVLVDDIANQSPACVEAESGFWASSTEFGTTLGLADVIRRGYRERKIRHADPMVQQQQDDHLRRRSIREAIQKTIEDNADSPTESSFFVSYPAKVAGYFVSVVLGLQTPILEEYPSLKAVTTPILNHREMPVATSLIDAVTSTFLTRSAGDLRLPDPGSDVSAIDAEGIVREGANRFMLGLAYRADVICFDGSHDFLISCTNLAATHYEGAVGMGTVVLASRENVSLEEVVKFREPPKLGESRAARKLLQFAAHDLALHTDSRELFGLVRVKGYDRTEESIFHVRFAGHHHWQVLHSGKTLMGVKYGQPYLPRPPYDEADRARNLHSVFRGMTPRHTQRILSLIREAEHESHGTTLLISEGAKLEAERLANQSTPIAPKLMTPAILRNLTPIDGAVLMNPTGTCYAVGVILDGLASGLGSSARGARYNTAIRYVESSLYPCLAVIVSSDGGVDFYPDLKQ